MAEPRIKIFSFGDNMLYAPGVSKNFAFNIPANNRELKIRSVYFDLNLWTTAPNVSNVPWWNNFEILVALTVGSATVGQEITNMFNFTLVAPSFNGTAIHLFQPQQVNFNSFTIFNTLPFLLVINNISAANTYRIQPSVAVEVEEKIIWNAPPVETFRIEE